MILCSNHWIRWLLAVGPPNFLVLIQHQLNFVYINHYANSEKNDISGFWSFGFQCTDLVDGRDGDVLNNKALRNLCAEQDCVSPYFSQTTRNPIS